MLDWPRSGSIFAWEVLKQIHTERDRGNWTIELHLNKPSLRELKEYLLGMGCFSEEAALVETLEKKRVSDRKGAPLFRC